MRQTSKTVSPMSNEGRNSYVVQHITDALLSLLSKKAIHEISISELCEKAGVGRASFYRNFESKEAILKTHINQLFQEWINEYNKSNDHSLSNQIQKIFAHFEEHEDFYKLLNERKLIYLLKDVVIGIVGPKPDYSKKEAYATAFVAYSLYGWIEVWFQRGMQETAEEIANLFREQNL
ncbi:TetR/AcrR family transcriptional regulator [Paenibacillus dakarensis]|uniref:TetR/AcrR family transcriptional regulator n=1 Tax=Paenibacillus dakarensis TaxID=1527293 RepID=UPI0009EC3E3C|nr:TetR/AcrR family transcriptional regulator [Paenibacillus dakarensis]